MYDSYTVTQDVIINLYSLIHRMKEYINIMGIRTSPGECVCLCVVSVNFF